MRYLWKKTLPIIIFSSMLGGGGFVLAQSQYPNPIAISGGAETSIPQLLAQLLGYLVALAIPLAALAVIVIGALYVIAAASGNPRQIETWKKGFFYVLTGAAVIIGAKFFAEAIIDFIRSL